MSSEVNLPRVRMLFADDDEFHRYMFRQTFDTYNMSTNKICIYDYVIVNNGKQAQEKIASEHFDVIVLDYNMGEINGCMVAKTAKKTDDTVICKFTSREEKETPDGSPISFKSDSSPSFSDPSPFPSFSDSSSSPSDPSPSPCYFPPSPFSLSPGARYESMSPSLIRYVPSSKNNSSLSSTFSMNSLAMIPSLTPSSILERTTTNSSSSSTSGMSSSAMTPYKTPSLKPNSITRFPENELNKTLPIVIIYSSEEGKNRTPIEEEAKKIGCSAYVFKPIKPVIKAGKIFTDLFQEYAPPSLFGSSASPS